MDACVARSVPEVCSAVQCARLQGTARLADCRDSHWALDWLAGKKGKRARATAPGHDGQHAQPERGVVCVGRGRAWCEGSSLSIGNAKRIEWWAWRCGGVLLGSCSRPSLPLLLLLLCCCSHRLHLATSFIDCVLAHPTLSADGAVEGLSHTTLADGAVLGFTWPEGTLQDDLHAYILTRKDGIDDKGGVMASSNC